MKKTLFALAAAVLCLSSCGKMWDAFNAHDTAYYRNQFAHDLMDYYYLWRAEVSDQLENWSYSTDPVAKVRSLRYKDGNGVEVDHWTTLYEDIRPFIGSVTGNTDSFGFDFLLVGDAETQTVEYGIVTYTYAGSPAAKAGLRRGDLFETLNGQHITIDNYSVLYNGGTVQMGMQDGSTVQLTAVKMYENPIQTVRTLEMGGKKIGYLHFTGFTLQAAVDLEDVFRQFKAQGIQELVMDLRYNGGGYTLTSQVLGSMIAPTDAVENGSIFNMDVYNANFSGTVTRFVESMDVTLDDGKKYTVHPAQVNPGLSRVWFITTGSSASASEALICGLKPYMDLYTVGKQSYGKYCGGYIFQAEDYYDAVEEQGVYGIDPDAGRDATRNWGIYVIATRYSDCAGNTLSMPDGIPADFPAIDNPADGHDFGDPEESMLSAVLERMGVKPATAAPRVGAASTQAPATLLPAPKPGFGTRILP